MPRKLKDSTILKRALMLFKDGKAWTTEYSARTKTNQPVPWDSPKAAKFCAIGALSRVSDGHYSVQLSQYLYEASGKRGAVSFNDSQTEFGPIKAWFERAIKLAQEAGK